MSVMMLRIHRWRPVTASLAWTFGCSICTQSFAAGSEISELESQLAAVAQGGAAPAGATAGSPQDASVPATDSAASSSPTSTPPDPVSERFGAQNSLRLSLEGDWIYNWDQANQAQGRIGLQWFFFENVELDVFGTLNYVAQPGPNAFGGGLDLQIRWHFIAMETWSVFFDIGGGILGTTEPVPKNGSSFNFTPNIGFGATFALDESTRLYVGARWFHISNAGLYAKNPGRENSSVWVGLSFKL